MLAHYAKGDNGLTPNGIRTRNLNLRRVARCLCAIGARNQVALRTRYQASSRLIHLRDRRLYAHSDIQLKRLLDRETLY